MKLTEIKQINEEKMSQEDLDSVQKAVDNFNKGIKKMFPEKEWIAQAKLTRILGYVVTIDFADRDWDVTIHNSRYHMSFMVHLTVSSGAMSPKMEMEMNVRSTELSNAGVNFRKIKGKDIHDLMDKALKWFKKNEKNIKDLTPSRDVIIKKLFKSMAVPPTDRKAKETEVTIIGGRAADALGVESGAKVILQKLNDKDLHALAKVHFIM